ADGQLPFPFERFEKRWHKALLNARINKENGTREENFHFHDLRHIFGSELLKRGVNPYLIKELFNHSDMTTSSIYMTAERSDLRDAVNRLDVQEIGGVN
ncbi:MAG: site-specific integrase, partial [bacterium]|nr:site-specific integrase [bacterium]